MQLKFTKMQGAGNDYIYLDCRQSGVPAEAGRWAAELSRRRFSVGADGLICIAPPLLADADATMVMFNADGSEGAMCGNGIRCVAEYLYTHGVQKELIELDTRRAGRKTLYRVGPHVWRAGMGRFSARAADLPAVGLGAGPLLDIPLAAAGRSWKVSCISMGNPHCVVFCREAPPTGAVLARWGEALACHPAFPEGTNVEFVQAAGPRILAATVWERGSGATLACGTGPARRWRPGRWRATAPGAARCRCGCPAARCRSACWRMIPFCSAARRRPPLKGWSRYERCGFTPVGRTVIMGMSLIK